MLLYSLCSDSTSRKGFAMPLFLDSDFSEEQPMQDSATTMVVAPSGRFDIHIMSRYRLEQDQLETIINVTDQGIARHYKPFDIGIDISLYTGFCDVEVIRKSSDNVTIIIN